MRNRNQSPFNALPPVVTAMAVVIGGIEVLFWLGGAGLLPNMAESRNFAIQDWSYFDPLWDRMIEHGEFSPRIAARSLSYALIHESPLHTGLALAFFLGFGNAVGRQFDAAAMLALFFGSTLAGALAYGLTNADAPLLGGYPGVFGLIGSYVFLLMAGNEIRGRRGRMALTLVSMMLGLQMLSWFLTGRLDWVADLAGFLAGFLLSFVVRPGGWRRLAAMIRRR